ncbi:MAG TPA: two-component sensor histidine kinase [Firmicutes bacterium]|jgi:two-component system, sensor histidine kinase YesM|nr:two-component sensor histidine kinase [Bacillota bacterium]
MFLQPKKTILNIVDKLIGSLRAKLLGIFIIMTILPLSIIGIISYTKSFSTIWDNTTLSTIQIGEQLNSTIGIFFKDIEKFTEIGYSKSSITFLRKRFETYNEAKDILWLFDMYRHNYSSSKSIKEIIIIGANGKCMSERKGFFRLNPRQPFAKNMNSLLAMPERIRIISNRDLSYYHNNPYDSRIVSMVAPIFREMTHEFLGVIIIDVDISMIPEFCQNIKIGKTGFFYIIDKNKNLLLNLAPNRQRNILPNYHLNKLFCKSKGSFIEKMRGKNYFIIYNTSQLTGWKIIGQVPLAEIMKEANQIKNVTIISIVICAICVVLLYFFISDKLTLPIRNLKEKMKQAASGNLDVKVASKNHDEIDSLGISFNKMIEKIKILMENSILEQKNLKKAELRTMQAQINPHFLYNTLDAIVWMAELKKNEQVIELVNALSNFFRITLSKGKDWIPVKEEVEHIKSYLAIQKIRYRDILDYEIRVADEMLDYKILKLTLQPLVENALYHGIKNKRGGGRIIITGTINGNGNLNFMVSDDGIGITPEKLAEILSGLNDETAEIIIKESGFGIKNVNNRIKLYYGKEYGLTIQSKYGKGTAVSILIRGDLDV